MGREDSAVIDFMQNKITNNSMNELKVSTYEKRDHLLFEQEAFVQSIKSQNCSC
jgi:hypothetical protein